MGCQVSKPGVQNHVDCLPKEHRKLSYFMNRQKMSIFLEKNININISNILIFKKSHQFFTLKIDFKSLIFALFYNFSQNTIIPFENVVF